MPKVAVLNMQGAQVREIELSDAIFGAEVHQYRVWRYAAYRLCKSSLLHNYTDNYGAP